MGFCRRCGDIVAGERCKCGGSAVTGTVAWKESLDPWTKTYVSRDKSPTRSSPSKPSVDTNGKAGIGITATPTSPTKRFPRPLSSYSSSSSNSIGKRVTEHITATTSQLSRPPSPLKNSTVVSPEQGILPSLGHHTTGSSLAKVYGSVLQSEASLSSHSCAVCGEVFPPDSTIYPEPYGEESSPTRFLCRDCFTSNGGTKGHCPGCSRPVLALKSEGPFIEAAGAHWHKKCFTCDGCGKNIGDSPLVDLLGKPSCAECFDSCLQRDHTPKKNRSSTTNLNSPSPNIGGVGSRSPSSKSREGSPALEELEQRLGIVKKRQSSPALQELSHRLSLLAASPKINRPDSLSRSPSPQRSIATPEESPLLNRSLRSSRSSRGDQVSELGRLESSRNRGSIFQRTSSNSPTLSRKPTHIEETTQQPPKLAPRSQASPARSPSPSPIFHPRLHMSRSSGSLSTLSNPLIASPTEAQTPDLLSDFSDSATQSSAGPDSPPRKPDEVDDVFVTAKLYHRGLGTRYAHSNFLEDHDDVIIEETNSQLNTPDNTPKHKANVSGKTTPISTPSKTLVTPIKSPRYTPGSGSLGGQLGSPASSSTTCAKCQKQLFSVREGGKYVTVPDDSGTPQTYHTACFTCSVCGGQAAFVKAEGGPCHIECAPPAKITVREVSSPPAQPLPVRRTHVSSKSISSLPSPPSPNTGSYVSSRCSPPVTTPLTSTSTSIPRFGGANSCPGCKKSVSQVSFGISEGERSVQGPNGTRWHRNCLVCGGKKEPSRGVILRGRDERKKGEPGCGKRLDSGAKTDGEKVFCRECSLLLPSLPTPSPTRTTAMPTPSGRVIPQLTGTTTLARQFTGLTYWWRTESNSESESDQAAWLI
ncbi:hypothetical protein GYMLUDRAFT_33286 [Collybiopsis luxurians FD-317 M1]|nr:hypothetical protein GYMLUDRAFT_33286 [Collybiopsis luxurians FD-317 M1]